MVYLIYHCTNISSSSSSTAKFKIYTNVITAQRLKSQSHGQMKYVRDAGTAAVEVHSFHSPALDSMQIIINADTSGYCHNAVETGFLMSLAKKAFLDSFRSL